MVQLWVVGNDRKRSLMPSVAIMKPRKRAPLSPMNMLAGLRFQNRKPMLAPKTAAARIVTRDCPSSAAKKRKKAAAIAATPEHNPSMWSRMLNAEVITTTHASVRDQLTTWNAGEWESKYDTKGQAVTRIPPEARIRDATGMPTTSFVNERRRPPSSRIPMRTMEVAPPRTQRSCPQRLGVESLSWSAKIQTVITKAPYMA